MIKSPERFTDIDADPNPRCPLTICRWVSLFRAIRLIDETARERELPEIKLNDHTSGAITSFIENLHGRLLQANFPNWKPGELLPLLEAKHAAEKAVRSKNGVNRSANPVSPNGAKPKAQKTAKAQPKSGNGAKPHPACKTPPAPAVQAPRRATKLLAADPTSTIRCTRKSGTSGALNARNGNRSTIGAST